MDADIKNFHLKWASTFVRNKSSAAVSIPGSRVRENDNLFKKLIPTQNIN